MTAAAPRPFWRPAYAPAYARLWLPLPGGVRRLVTADPDIEVSVIAASASPSTGGLAAGLVVDVARRRCVFLDPGVRHFQTFYSPDGTCGTIGGPVFAARVAALLREYAVARGIDCDRADRAVACLRREVDDLQVRACRFLMANYDVVFLPRFGAAQADAAASEIGCVMFAAHDAFRERLGRYAALLRSKAVCEVPEHFTTKTCGRCGARNEPGASRAYACGGCGLVIDRDINAARNLCLSVVTLALAGGEGDPKGARAAGAGHGGDHDHPDAMRHVRDAFGKQIQLLQRQGPAAP